MFDADINVSHFALEPSPKAGVPIISLKDSLSTREEEICKLLANGMRLRDVAHMLSISIHTAHAHTRNAYLKLRVHDREELARHFAEPSGRSQVR
jgi:DNA-binding CsgD family transcriptional regulator